MKISEINDEIATGVCAAYSRWLEILENTTPGHYGVNDCDVDVHPKDIYSDVPNGCFTFKNATLSFSVRLGGSSDESGFDVKCKKVVSGEGSFKFENAKKIKVLDFSINEELDIYDDSDCRSEVASVF